MAVTSGLTTVSCDTIQSISTKTVALHPAASTALDSGPATGRN
jgi:hypothetical protein